MVYKFRNKNLFMTRHGFKVNWHNYGLIQPKDIYPETTFSVRSRDNHHSYLRRR
jgi:hypothetical protein